MSKDVRDDVTEIAVEFIAKLAELASQKKQQLKNVSMKEMLEELKNENQTLFAKFSEQVANGNIDKKTLLESTLDVIEKTSSNFDQNVEQALEEIKKAKSLIDLSSEKGENLLESLNKVELLVLKNASLKEKFVSEQMQEIQKTLEIHDYDKLKETVISKLKEDGTIHENMIVNSTIEDEKEIIVDFNDKEEEGKGRKIVFDKYKEEINVYDKIVEDEDGKLVKKDVMVKSMTFTEFSKVEGKEQVKEKPSEITVTNEKHKERALEREKEYELER